MRAMTVSEILGHIASQKSVQKMHIMRRLLGGESPKLRRQKFASEYTVDFNKKRASKAAGYKTARHATHLLREPEVQAIVQAKMQEREEGSALKAEYVRQFIHDVLEFSPLEFFVPAPEGGWLITEESFMKLPQRVRRLIEHVELRDIRGNKFLSLTFVSKTAVLAMAARYTLTQHIDATVRTMPWDEIAGKLEKAAEDPIAKRMAEVDAVLVNGAKHK